MDDLQNLLSESENKIFIPWQKFINMAQWCNEMLMSSGGTLKITCEDHTKKELDSIVQLYNLPKFSEDPVKQFSTDPFYYPAYFKDENGKERVYGNEWAEEDLKKILSPDFSLPKNLFSKDNLVIFYVLALKKAFFDMSQIDNPPIKTALYLASILAEIYKKVAAFREEMQQEKENRKQNSKKSRKFSKNIQEIIKDDRYKQIRKLIEYLMCDNSKDDQDLKREIDGLIKNILPISDSKSLRIYREVIVFINKKIHPSIEVNEDVIEFVYSYSVKNKINS